MSEHREPSDKARRKVTKAVGDGGPELVALPRVGAPTEGNLNRPAPFRLDLLAESWRTWIVWDDEAAGPFRGFAIYVRENVTVAERQAILKRDAEILEYNRRWISTPPDKRTADDFVERGGALLDPRTIEYEFLAPYVLDWNAVGRDNATGEPRPIPAPAVAGGDAFECIYREQFVWLRGIIVGGYAAGKGLTNWHARLSRSSPEATPSTGDSAATDGSDQKRRAS